MLKHLKLHQFRFTSDACKTVCVTSLYNINNTRYDFLVGSLKNKRKQSRKNSLCERKLKTLQQFRFELTKII